MDKDYVRDLRERARKKLYEEWRQIGDFDIGIEATLESMGEIAEIPGGWEEIHREMGGEAVENERGYVNIRFPHPHLEFGELIMEFKPTFLSPKTKVGIILIAFPEEEPNDQEASCIKSR